MQFFLILFTNLALVFTMIAIHETGHYLAGLTAGIPASVMKIRLFTFPQHVALRDGDLWVSPVANIERYIAVRLIVPNEMDLTESPSVGKKAATMYEPISSQINRA